MVAQPTHCTAYCYATVQLQLAMSKNAPPPVGLLDKASIERVGLTVSA